MPIPSLNFLIAEDHGHERRALARMLRSGGARGIHEASDVSEALKVIQAPNRQVDIVIIDLDMPGMDGGELIRCLGESKRRASIIVSSSPGAHLLASVATTAQAYGVMLLGVVAKPLTLLKLAPLFDLHERPQLVRGLCKTEHPAASLEAIR